MLLASLLAFWGVIGLDRKVWVVAIVGVEKVDDEGMEGRFAGQRGFGIFACPFFGRQIKSPSAPKSCLFHHSI